MCTFSSIAVQRVVDRFLHCIATVIFLLLKSICNNLIAACAQLGGAVEEKGSVVTYLVYATPMCRITTNVNGVFFVGTTWDSFDCMAIVQIAPSPKTTSNHLRFFTINRFTRNKYAIGWLVLMRKNFVVCLLNSIFYCLAQSL